jgi:hypothetical protein
MSNDEQKLRIVDDPSVRPAFASKVVMTGMDGGTITVTLGDIRFLPSRIGQGPKQGEHPSVYVTARLALTPTTAVELVNNLSRILNAMGVPKVASTGTTPPAAH